MIHIPSSLPKGICIKESVLPSPESCDSISLSRRQTELTIGRSLARTLLSDLGFNDALLTTRPDRSPEWPDGSVGSISHAWPDSNAEQGRVVVAVARSTDCQNLGIDIEFNIQKYQDLATLALTEPEHCFPRLTDDCSSPGLWIWCAKEAAMKTWRKIFDPCQVAILNVQYLSNNCLSFTASPLLKISATTPASLQGITWLDDRCILACCW